MKKILLTVVCVICCLLPLLFLFIGDPKPPQDPNPDPPPPPTENVYFYRNLHDAVSVISSEDYKNASFVVTQQEAGVSVKVDDENTTISLLKNEQLTETLILNKNVTIDLSGKVITSQCSFVIKVDGANVVINGAIQGSKISVSNQGFLAIILQVVSGSCSINGGTYETNTSIIDTTQPPNSSIICESGSLSINNAYITSKDSNNGVLYGITINEGATAVMNNSSVVVDSPYGLNSYGVNNQGTLTAVGCTINAYANYLANEAKTDYATCSRGVYNTGTATIKNCTVYGTHSGITSKGTLYIDGGTYEGYGHGGIYLSSEGKTSYIKNATFKDCEMKNNYIDDGIAGTNRAGAYIGGASNVTLYIDNCNFSGGYYPFVMRSSGYKVDGVKVYESNISVYISNSSIDFERQDFRYIRVDAGDSANQKLYIGSGNNFTPANGVYKESNTVVTSVDYSEVFPNF